jgi:hypothetical protein
MKRTAFFIGIMLFSFAASAQTGIYKHFAKRPGVRAYCVERYPLASGDSICVTLLEVDDSLTYKALRKELKSLPFTPRKNYNLYVPLVSELEDSLQTSIKPRDTKSKKSLEGFTADGLDGDKGFYMIYMPSDRYVILAFLCRGLDDLIKVNLHMLATEF